MKILLVGAHNLHPKNRNAINHYKNIHFDYIHNCNEINNIDLTLYDAVYSPAESFDSSKFPNTKFMFGPHITILPDNQVNIVKHSNSVYNQLCDWNVKVWGSFPVSNGLRLIALPFGVETEKFKPACSIQEKTKVFIYCKNRHPELYEYVKQFLNNLGINYHIFHYGNYHEHDYLNYLKESKYGIWIGRHESQGFALEECLSMNVPLLVWDVKSMNEEHTRHYENHLASAIPYWDERCGEYFFNKDDLSNTYKTFISKLENYKPRDFIIENLSIEVCEQKMINTIQNI